MSAPALVLVAHGTRNPHGVEMIAELAEQVSRTVPLVRTAFVDVLGPLPSEVLRDLGGMPAVVVPAFLASGYHVHVDVPREVAGHHAVVTPALGPHPELARIMAIRLRAAGWRRGDGVVFAAAGSSDRRARTDVCRAALMLGERLGEPAPVAYVATGAPRVADAVEQLRRSGRSRVFVASYLLADGLFQQRLYQAGADGVADPIGGHPGVARLIIDHYRAVSHPISVMP